jgi:hypothetical protein
MPASRGGRTIQGDPARKPPDPRITIALIPKAEQDLQKLQDRTGYSKTDLVNRAVSLYEFIDAQQRDGHKVLIRDKDGELQTLLLL